MWLTQSNPIYHCKRGGLKGSLPNFINSLFLNNRGKGEHCIIANCMLFTEMGIQIFQNKESKFILGLYTSPLTWSEMSFGTTPGKIVEKIEIFKTKCSGNI